MPLEYPVTREYTIPHLTTYISLVSVLAISVLVVLNVVLLGYDVVAVLRPDPNATQSYWWSTGLLPLRSAGSCNPVSLPRRMTFSTNSSLFSYKIHSAFDANKQSIAGASSYMANPFISCTVDSVTVDIDLSRGSFKFDTYILCTGSEPPFSLSLVSTFSLYLYNPYKDDILAYYTQNKPAYNSLQTNRRLIQRNASSLVNVVGIVDLVSSDLISSLRLLKSATQHAIPTTISTEAFLVCPGGEGVTCKPEEMRMAAAKALMIYPDYVDISEDGIVSFLEPAKRSSLNMFTVLQDAYHIDLGNIKPYSTLLNNSAFSAHIRPDPSLSAAVQNTSLGQVCSVRIGCVYNATWADQLLTSDPDPSVTGPSVLSAGNAPSVVKVDYLCPQFRIKSPGSLFTSVFIATWTMYTALFGVFGLVGPMLERLYSRRRAAKAREKINILRLSPGRAVFLATLREHYERIYATRERSRALVM